MNQEDLKELREIFRKRMNEEDFCIGKYEVEKLFRELLDEPEELDVSRYSVSHNIRAGQLEEFMMKGMSKEKVMSLFDRDDMFYKNLKKR